MMADDGAPLIRVQIQLDRALLDTIDQARGDVSRSLFVRRRLQDWAGASPEPATRARETREEFTGGLVSKLDLPLGQIRGPQPKSGKRK